MANNEQLQNEILALFKSELELDVPGPDTDLIEHGYLDSLRFVQLLAVLEDKTGLKFDIEDLEIQNFTTPEKISEFISRKMTHDASLQ